MRDVRVKHTPYFCEIGQVSGSTLAHAGVACDLINKIGILMAKTTDTKTKKPKSAPKTGTAKSQPRAGEGCSTPPAGPPRKPGVERRQNHPSRAKHGYIQLILTQNVPQVGQSGELVKVRPGFARNYLVPQGMATFATANNLRMVEKHRQRLKELEEAAGRTFKTSLPRSPSARSRSRPMRTRKAIFTAR